MKDAPSIIKKISIAIFIAFIISGTLYTLIYGPQELINTIGIKNGYIAIFILATTSGFSSLTAFGFYSTVATFSLAGLNPLIVGILGGLGVTIGDSVFFYLGIKGRKLVKGNFKNILIKSSNFIEKSNKITVSIIIFLYSMFAPLPNDILGIVLALSKYPFKYYLPIILIGNIVYITLISISSIYGIPILLEYFT